MLAEHKGENMRFLGIPIIIIAAAAMLAPPTAALAAGDEWSDHPHHLALILGTTNKSGKWAETYGLEYTYRLSELWALGGWYEESTGDFELESWGVIGNLFVGPSLPILIGVGAEQELFGETKYLGRLGVQYQFHPGNISVAPTGWVDFVENGNELYFIGVTVGFGF